MDLNLEQFTATLSSELQACETREAVLALKSRYLNQTKEMMQGLKNLPPDQKREIGPKLNDMKKQVEESAGARLAAIESAEASAALSGEWIDTTLRESNMSHGLQCGGYHPMTLVQREIEDIFYSMGFDVLDGPHIEQEYYNFDALNTPADHPARDMQDTFWFKRACYLLRTQTSAVQIRGMEAHRPPFRFIVPGKVFRCERTDAGHEMVFHQLEGMMVDKEISVANLIYFMRTLLREVLGREVEIRLRPGFFPFVEPGFELDIRCLICSGSGCAVCKKSGWVELCPCGMVNPAVLKHGNIDPSLYTGFAFGLGLDRLTMMRYAINDIRLINSGDLRFLTQFKEF